MAEYFSKVIANMSRLTTRTIQHVSEAVQHAGEAYLGNSESSDWDDDDDFEEEGEEKNAEVADDANKNNLSSGENNTGNDNDDDDLDFTRPPTAEEIAAASAADKHICPTLKECLHTWRWVPPFFTKPTACDHCNQLLYLWEGRFPYCQQCKCCLHNKCWDSLRSQLAAIDIVREEEERKKKEERDTERRALRRRALRQRQQQKALLYQQRMMNSTNNGDGDGDASAAASLSPRRRHTDVSATTFAGFADMTFNGTTLNGLDLTTTAFFDETMLGMTTATDMLGETTMTDLTSTVAIRADANVQIGFRHMHELTLTKILMPSRCDCCEGLMLPGAAAYACTGCDLFIHKDCVEALSRMSAEFEAESEAIAAAESATVPPPPASSSGSHGAPPASAVVDTPHVSPETSPNRRRYRHNPYKFKLDTDTNLAERLENAESKKKIILAETTKMLGALHRQSPEWHQALVSPLLMAKLVEQHRQRYRQLCDELEAEVKCDSGATTSRGDSVGGDGKTMVDAPALSKEEMEAAVNALRFATAAYGESYRTSYMSSLAGGVAMRLFARDLLEPKDDVSNEAVVAILGLPRENLLYAKWSALVLEPSYCCIFDRRSKSIFIAFRGSLSDADFLSDGFGHGDSFEYPAAAGQHAAHSGMLTMVQKVCEDKELVRTVRRFLKQNPEYELVVTGHSLGAALTCLYTMNILRDRAFGRHRKVKAFAFAPPPVATLSLASIFDKNIYSFICGDDMVCRTQVASVARLTAQIEAVATAKMTPEAAVLSSTSMAAAPSSQRPAASSSAAAANEPSTPSGAPSPTLIDAADINGELLPIGSSCGDEAVTGGPSSSAPPPPPPLPPSSCSSIAGEELHIVGRCFLMPHPKAPSNKMLLPIDRAHPLLRQIFISMDMVENHLMDVYQATMQQCLDAMKGQ